MDPREPLSSRQPEPIAVLHPLLSAELADEESRQKLAVLAEERGIAIVPLADAPVDTALHVLEVRTIEDATPLLFYAEPLGPPTDEGFPLRLHPYEEHEPGGFPQQVDTARAPTPIPDDAVSLRAARPKRTTLTERHSQDLTPGARPAMDEPASAEALVGRDIDQGKLLIEALVGTGGMGSVYRARHRQLAIDIAVKVLHARYRSDVGFCARFHAEALAVSQLDHPNVVRIVDYGQEPDGLLYLAMEYLAGEELEAVLQREGRLTTRRVVDLGMQVAAGLGHAHARGIVHRDVKPSNVILVRGEDDEGHAVELAKICDFGIAVQTGTGDHLGTPAYMSPEQCAQGAVDARSDVYSLGVILYEIATGQLPFPGSAAEVIRKQMQEPPPPPSLLVAIDPALEALVLSMLEKAPMARPQTMRAVRQALRAIGQPPKRSPSLSLHAPGAGRADRAAVRDEPPSSRDASSPPTPITSIGAMPAVVDPRALAATLANEPVSTVRERLVSYEVFAAAARPLAQALRLLLEQGELAAFSEASLVLRRVAVDHAGDPRAELSARIVRSLHDPALFGAAADRALGADDPTATNLLATFGLAGAHALYGARVRAHPTPAVRGRFVAALRAIGPAATSLVEAALERHAPGGIGGDEGAGDVRLVEDLLRALTPAASDTLGSTLTRCLRWGGAGVRRAAIPALVVAWGERARAVLLGVLARDPDEGARVLAAKGLRELGAIDEHVVRRADEALATGTLGPALESALAELLAEATPAARPLAAAVVKRALSPKGGIAALMRAKGTSASVGLVLTMARVLLELAPDEGAALVTELAGSCDEPLRTQLSGLLGPASSRSPAPPRSHSVAKR